MSKERLPFFVPNGNFKRRYRSVFKKNPLAANMLLLLCELADERGDVRFETPSPERNLANMLLFRFDGDPGRYAL